jgi:hypothetical protein
MSRRDLPREHHFNRQPQGSPPMAAAQPPNAQKAAPRPFSNHPLRRKHFLACLSSLLLAGGAFFGSTAPQAFFRPNHIPQRPARTGHVKAGRPSRPPKAWPLHDRARRQTGGIGPIQRLHRFGFGHTWLANLCRVHRSLRGRGTLAALWTFESFGVASPERDHRGVAQGTARSRRAPHASGMAARPSRNDNSPE